MSGYCAWERRELAARLALLAMPGLKQEQVISLIEGAGSARAAIDALADVIGPEAAEAARGEAVRERTRRALHAVESQELHAIGFDDVAYPTLLAERCGRYRPPLLFARGELGLLELTAVGVVGCRAASEYGLDVAAELGDAVARAGGCVVSGLALGIDAAAHDAALAADGATIGILGCGVDVYYPRQNARLQERIASTGLLLSEHLPGEPPRKHQFPWRNRIIAALSQAVVVVEAGERSGSLITAGHAIEYGVHIFAVPNAIDRPNMAGVLRLYATGVLPYLGARDLLQLVGLIGLADPAPTRGRPVEYAPPDETAARVWLALGTRGLHVDRIAAAAELPAGQTLALLTELELDGYATQLRGSRYVRRTPTREPVAAGGGRR